MDRRLFLLLLTSLIAPSVNIVSALPAYASPDDDDDDYDYDDGDDDHDDDDDDDDQKQALEALKAQETISLKEMIRLFEEEFDGKIIDISLYRKRAKLIYRFKYIDNSGYVKKAYFNANSGELLGK